MAREVLFLDDVERVVGLVAAALVVVAGCASDAEGPPAFEPDIAAEADAELRELDFGDDELVADEGTDDELADPNLVLPEENREGLAEEDLSELSDLEDLEADDGIDDELEGEEGSLETASIASPPTLLPASIAPLAAPTDRTWFAERFACPNNAKNCVCRGSKHNCQFPNSQPGRNRYLPPDAVRAIRSVTGKQTKKLFINALGKWGVQPGTILRDGRGVARGVIKVLPFVDEVLTSVSEETSSNRCFHREGNAVKQTNVPFPCVRINAGQKKRITVDGTPREFVYAFGVRLEDGTNASGWIPRASIRSGEFEMRAAAPIGGTTSPRRSTW